MRHLNSSLRRGRLQGDFREAEQLVQRAWGWPGVGWAEGETDWLESLGHDSGLC